MKAVCNFAEWDPRPEFKLGSKDIEGQLTYLGSKVWRHPHIEIVEKEIPKPGPTEVLIEVNWQQQLSFLPGFLNGLGIYANYTYTKSSADLPDRADSILPGQSGSVGNLALTYEKYGFTARFGVNYHGKYIWAVGEDEDSDIYYDSRMQFDFSASQRLFEDFRVYVEAINLSNRPLRYYIGDTLRPIKREFYSWWMHAGIKWSL